MPCPPPGDHPNPGIEPLSLISPALAGGFLTTSATEISEGYEEVQNDAGFSPSVGVFSTAKMTLINYDKKLSNLWNFSNIPSTIIHVMHIFMRKKCETFMVFQWMRL